jgi:hypothetical protein
MTTYLLQELQNANLNLDYFFNISISQSGSIRMLTTIAEAEQHLIDLGFKQIDYLYADNDKMIEYQKGCINATLCK